ncbi:SAM-dependent methyltransferase [Acetobacteraceae bacterium KSS8]|uniref:SAM-dependent methyltransferase n=1 Tax=Endosaccharibacter trunci TaxID=2812733 RepID=A0ABT1W9J1_9PROT|nr:SAM-dependent methyltransferase [Acetobacteraceae bacterium KSS8]
MARANAAYYAGRDPFADFVTAPEIAQAFGELIGAWAAVCWQSMGAPDPVLLCEAGPGRGTLMADALRLAARVAPAFRAALRVHLVETSPRLRAVQAEALAGADPVWHDTIDALPDGPMILIGNEFLDALPIRQMVWTPAEGWRERFVRAGAFVLEPAEAPPPGEAPVVAGQVMEFCEPARAIVAGLARRVAETPGAVLLLDYGPDRPGSGDTLQALRDGQPAPPLETPGEADLTAHVDFPALRAIAEKAGAVVWGPESQGAFLSALGLFQRTEQLARGKPPEQARALVDAAHRLAAPERMGQLFKAMALCHPSMGVSPGFSPSRSNPEDGVRA